MTLMPLPVHHRSFLPGCLRSVRLFLSFSHGPSPAHHPRPVLGAASCTGQGGGCVCSWFWHLLWGMYPHPGAVQLVLMQWGDAPRVQAALPSSGRSRASLQKLPHSALLLGHIRPQCVKSCRSNRDAHTRKALLLEENTQQHALL